MEILALAQQLIAWMPEKYRPAAMLALILWVVCSLVMAMLNARVRARAEAGVKFTPRSLRVLAFMNLVALNPDKALQFLRGYRGPSLAPGALPPRTGPQIPFGGGASL